MTTVSKQEFTDYIRQFRHRELFNYLGWDNDRTLIPPQKAGEEIVLPKIIADKNGFKIIAVQVERIPQYAVRNQVVVALKKLFAESIVIFTDKVKCEQVWRYGKVEIKYNADQDTERLYQRASGLIFDIDEQDNITIVDVTARVRTNFAANAERVTKKFYDGFRKEHKALLELMSGITNTLDREWYASIMLNRLMFCYFMQRRGFLNNDRDYLRNKLNESKQKLGKGKFYSFYRSFLMVLFQKGFGTYEHPAEVVDMIGKIPYLNGGLFDLHEVEHRNPDIDISDEAFERIFDLFGRFEWHLDTRDCATGDEINPDVLGYIFEKYINDRAAMGAYYTQEDITGYISRSTILPYLLDSVKKTYPKPFEKDGAVWAFLRDNGDAYIFDSMKKGADLPLPEHITVGVDTTAPDLIERRKAWNTPAPAEYALPTEIWREVVDRRNRYFNVKGKIENGEISESADFITYNLDIVNFVNDLLATIDDPSFVEHFYRHLEKVTVLDPTCGSGAFLFAAMNILEPLYDVCLSRMEDYLDTRLARSTHRYFDEKLEQMEDAIHPNKHYFIYKSIILNNLYGVDIMREAVETAKLRLFLKLVSTAQPQLYKDNYGIEPLPDIDFNVKCGNTLIGFATKTDIDDAYRIGNEAQRAEVYNKMLTLSNATARYKQYQLGNGDYSSGDFKTAKADLNNRQSELRAALDALLKSTDYAGVSKSDWQTKYLPFHWAAEFYSIIVENGGFDVVIGNPPYVEYSKVQGTYKLKGYDTISCGNLYAFVVERALKLLRESYYSSFIIPISSISSGRSEPFQKIVSKQSVWQSSYSNRPAKLFQGVEQRLTILVMKNVQGEHHTTSYSHWYSEEREDLFHTIYYSTARKRHQPKIGNHIEANIFDSICEKKPISARLELLSTNNTHLCYFHDAPTYWIRSMSFNPAGEYVSEKSNHYKTIKCVDRNACDFLVCLLNSSLYYLFFKAVSNCRDFGMDSIYNFGIANNIDYTLFAIVAPKLMESYKNNRAIKSRNYPSGMIEYYEYYPQKSKPIIDQIDTILAEHYGLTEEELDYIINYDIKYRMGIGGEVGDDE